VTDKVDRYSKRRVDRPSPMGGVEIRRDSPVFFPYWVDQYGQVQGMPPVVKHDRKGKVTGEKNGQ